MHPSPTAPHASDWKPVIIIKVPSIKLSIFFDKHRPERDIGTAYRIIILLSLLKTFTIIIYYK